MSPVDSPPPSARPRRSLWGWCRCSFRWCRIAALAAVLLVLATLTWLRVMGLPDFLRLRIVDELARRGIAADFRSLHFHWFRGLVARDLRVAWGGTNGPRATLDEADLDLAPPLVSRSRQLVRGVAVRHGTFTLPLPLTNEPPLDLRLDDITAEVRFLPGDAWDIRRLSARLAGVQFDLRARLTNTAALRKPRAPASPEARERQRRLLRSVVHELQTWTDASSARFDLSLDIDGANLAGTRADVFLEVPSARTPRGDLDALRCSFRVQPGISTNDPNQASAVVELGELRTPQGGISQFALRANLSGPPGQPLPSQASWEARFDHLFLQGLRARGVTFKGTTRLPAFAGPGTGGEADPLPASALALTNLVAESELSGNAFRLEIGRDLDGPIVATSAAWNLAATGRLAAGLPSRLRGTVTAGTVEGKPGATGPVNVRLDLSARTEPGPAPADLAGWTHAWPYQGDVGVEVADVNAMRGLKIERFSTDLAWQPPEVRIRRLDASLYRGELRAHGGLDVLTREVTLNATSTFDLHGIDGLLGPRSRENFVRYQWTEPPWFEARARAILPAWTNRQPDWDGEVKHSIRLDARFRTGAGGFKGIPFDRAESSLSFDGVYWRLPDLKTARPEGRQEIAVDYNEETREYRIDARGRVLPHVLKPVLGTASGEVVDLFEFRHGVDAEVIVWGPWSEGTSQGILGHLVATNFLFRGHRFDRLEATANYTNRFLVASPVHLVRDAGELRAEGVGYDFADDRLWLTNATSTIDHLVAAAAISPGFPEKLAPYRFLAPPRIHANGTVQPRRTESADLVFDIDGGPFEFWRLRAETLSTRLHWQGTSLLLTNIHGAFFGGTLDGSARFDLEDPADGLYQFEARVRQARLGDLLRHATAGRTNVADGPFDLDLTVTSARTADLHSWNGYGKADLEDGLIWDAPIFGFLSPVMNAIVPGLGNNRARSGSAHFTMTNSVIHTRDLVINCPPAKLFYRGSLDFEQNVNAKVEAQVLGDVLGVGPLFGLLLRPLTKLFEFKVTGTLNDVEAEPLYVPKFLLLPLQPIKILRGLFGAGDGTKPASTNTEPAQPSPPTETIRPP